MLGIRKKPREAIQVQASEAPRSSQHEAAAPPPHVALLQRWMSVAEMQQRVIQVLVGEIAHTSGLIETEADDLSDRFRRLAVSTRQQTERVDSLTLLATGIEVKGEAVPIRAITELLESTLSDIVRKILLLSKDSMTMVYALGELNANVERVEGCMEQLSAINSTTNMLALNARIEAERAGSAGAAFRVVANEVRELSKATQNLSANMNQTLKSLTEGIADGHVTMKRVATIDMSDNLAAKERLERFLAALLQRGSAMESIVANAAREAGIICSDVDAMVTGIQFQDRTKQRLEHVVDTLQVVSQAIEEVKQGTTTALPELAGTSPPDTSWVKHLLERYTMSEVRERFVAELLEGKPVAWPEDSVATGTPSSSGSIELF